MTAKPLAQASALVVGGTGGIGLACAQALLAAGVPRLVVAGRSSERGEAARAALAASHPQGAIAFVRCDATDAAAADALAHTAADAMGGIDVLVSSGGSDPSPRLLHEIPTAGVMPELGSIVAGLILPARAVLPYMTRGGGGSVICFASDAAKVATPGESVIGAATASA